MRFYNADLFTDGVQPFDFKVKELISLKMFCLFSMHQPEVGQSLGNSFHKYEVMSLSQAISESSRVIVSSSLLIASSTD